MALVVSLLVGCGDGDKDSADSLEAGAGDAGALEIPLEETPKKLSEWHLFSDLAKLAPAKGVIPYEMRSPLFTDYAEKQRFLYVPEGKQIGYSELEAWRFPVGSILVKDFSYPRDPNDPKKGLRHLETRLMIHRKAGWVPEVYVWNDEQTDATRDVTGETIAVTRLVEDGKTSKFNYDVPSRAECRKCHGTPTPIEGAEATRTLGPMTPQLNMEHDYGDGMVNQIDHLAKLGLFDKKPEAASKRLSFALPEDRKAPVSERARAYLHANCAHCHAKKGEVFEKELWLDYASTAPEADPYAWGVCKKPTSAGNAECDSDLDIVPGDPDASLLVCRMEAKGKGRMAPLGRNLAHTEGIALVRAWIAGLDLPSCQAP